MREEIVAGIFVGGNSSRMGRAKGLLPAPTGGTLVDRWVALLDAFEIPIVLVGRKSDYASLPFFVVDDAVPNAGPLSGLVALLEHAGEKKALALACDMPFVSADLLKRLIFAPNAAIVAPRREGKWEPLCARYDAPRVALAAKKNLAEKKWSLQTLLDDVEATALSMNEAEARELVDWDTPEEIR